MSARKAMKILEYLDEYNPFNKFKLLAWVNYWKQFKEGVIPPPVAVSVDPINTCNHRCVWCNAGSVLKQNKGMMKRDFIIDLADFLGRWGVRSVCIGGGGESLLNPHTGTLITNCIKKGIETAVVTNGTNVDRFLDELSLCRWIGVSVDAGTEKTHTRLHRPVNTSFKRIIGNIKKLATKSRRSKNFEVTYKFLMHPENINELYRAARLARDLGVNRFHARPVGETWFGMKHIGLFSNDEIKKARREMDRVFKLCSNSFSVYGITSRNYTETFGIKHRFGKCRAVFMTCVFQPNRLVSLCCDRRGDTSLDLCRLDKPEDMLKYWGRPRHKKIAGGIRLKDCPRCTYSSHNEIYENATENDNLFVNFI